MSAAYVWGHIFRSRFHAERLAPRTSRQYGLYTMEGSGVWFWLFRFYLSSVHGSCIFNEHLLPDAKAAYSRIA